jgi:hypothetical protein
MTLRKWFALVALVGIVPAIAIIRLQMTPTAGGTAASMSSIALFVESGCSPIRIVIMGSFDSGTPSIIS